MTGRHIDTAAMRNSADRLLDQLDYCAGVHPDSVRPYLEGLLALCDELDAARAALKRITDMEASAHYLYEARDIAREALGEEKQR